MLRTRGSANGRIARLPREAGAIIRVYSPDGNEASGYQAREALAARSCKRRMSRPCRDLMMSHIDCVQVPHGSQEVSFGG